MNDALDKIGRLCDAATPGPWQYPGRGYKVYSSRGNEVADAFGSYRNASFIAASRILIPALLRLVRTQQELIGAMKDCDNAGSAMRTWSALHWEQDYNAFEEAKQRKADVTRTLIAVEQMIKEMVDGK